MYTAFDTVSFVVKALECGASAYVTKSADENELIRALKEIAEGSQYIQQSLRSKVLSASMLLSPLTKKERIVAGFVLDGMENDKIADIMGIKVRTVENYMSSIYDKIGVRDKRELIHTLNNADSSDVQVFKWVGGGYRQ